MPSPAKKRAAALLRVSTDMQDLDSQRLAVEGWAEREGATITWYEEEAVSGAARSRPVLEQMVKDARAGKFRVLVVHALDRVARDVVRLVTTLDELDHAGVDLVSLREGLDFRGPMGRAMASLLGAIGEIERANIRDRVRAGMAAAKAKGKHVGRPRLEPTEADVAEVLEFREQGLSLRAITGKVAFFDSKGVARSPSPAYLHRLLKERCSERPPADPEGAAA